MKNSRIAKPKKKTKSSEIFPNPMQQELAGLIEGTKEKAKEAKQNTQTIGKKIQSVIDEADLTLALLANIDPQYYEGLKDIWNSTYDQVSRINANLGQTMLSTTSASSTASISSTIISGAYINDGFRNVDEPEFKSAWVKFVFFANRPELRNEVTQLFKEYGFDKPQVVGDKSPLEHFEIAHEGFQNPIIENNPVSTSLIPMRECINSIIASLLKMRPTQEVTKNERAKIMSIGMQLKKDTLPQAAIDELADEWYSINNDFSNFKKKDVERTDWLARLNRGTSFLYSLLNGLDSTKLRK